MNMHTALIVQIAVLFAILCAWAIHVISIKTSYWMGSSYQLHKLYDSELCNRQWEPWFAWHPVKDMNGRWRWREHIYRKVGNTYIDHDDYTWYYYLTDRELLIFLLRWS
jgi:hypothetical protein